MPGLGPVVYVVSPRVDHLLKMDEYVMSAFFDPAEDNE